LGIRVDLSFFLLYMAMSWEREGEREGGREGREGRR